MQKTTPSIFTLNEFQNCCRVDSLLVSGKGLSSLFWIIESFIGENNRVLSATAKIKTKIETTKCRHKYTEGKEMRLYFKNKNSCFVFGTVAPEGELYAFQWIGVECSISFHSSPLKCLEFCLSQIK